MVDKILQIIPGDGWFALHRGGLRMRVVCWALVENQETGATTVDGMNSLSNHSFCEDNETFDRYVHESDLEGQKT